MRSASDSDKLPVKFIIPAVHWRHLESTTSIFFLHLSHRARCSISFFIAASFMLVQHDPVKKNNDRRLLRFRIHFPGAAAPIRLFQSQRDAHTRAYYNMKMYARKMRESDGEKEPCRTMTPLRPRALFLCCAPPMPLCVF